MPFDPLTYIQQKTSEAVFDLAVGTGGVAQRLGEAHGRLMILAHHDWPPDEELRAHYDRIMHQLGEDRVPRSGRGTVVDNLEVMSVEECSEIAAEIVELERSVRDRRAST